MVGHTKGPWRVEEGTTLVWGSCNPDDTSTYGMGYPITDCRITPISSWANGPDADEGEANANLISAAPDLLDALQHLSHVYEQVWVKISDGEMEIVRGAWEFAEAAIAKAKGK